MRKDFHLHIRCDAELKEYLSNLGGDSKGVYELYHTHKDLRQALIDGGLESLEPSDLVGLVRCLINNRNRKRGRVDE